MMPAYGAIASLIEQMKAKKMGEGSGQPPMPEPQAGLLATPPQMPPDPPQGRGLLANAPTPEQMLAQQLSQNPVQGGPPQAGLMDPQPMPDGAPDNAHAHQQGIRGGLLHLLGADRMAPEIAAQLTPEQESRVRPGLAATLWNAVAHRAGPQQVQRHRAAQILGDQDTIAARAKVARDEATLGDIRQEAARLYPTDPQAQVEYVAQSSAARIGGVTQATQAAVGLRERVQPAPRAPITKTTAEGIMQYNLETNQWEPMVDAQGRPMMAPPREVTGSFGISSDLRGPNNRPMIRNNQTGELVEAPEGVTVAGAPTQQEIKIISEERTLAYDDAQLSIAGLLDANGRMKDPPSSWDRFATQTDWLNWAATDEGQDYMSNTRKLIRSWAILLEGKRFSDADARAAEMMRSFRPGDKSLVIEGKKYTLESMAASIRALGRPRAATPSSAAPASGAQRKPTYEEWLATQGRP